MSYEVYIFFIIDPIEIPGRRWVTVFPESRVRFPPCNYVFFEFSMYISDLITVELLGWDNELMMIEILSVEYE